MAEQIIDVHLDFDTLRLAQVADPTRLIYEASQKAAEDEAERRGARLRHPDPRETVVKEATDPLSGRDVLLVGTRWIVDK
jgi:hypothetical protein